MKRRSHAKRLLSERDISNSNHDNIVFWIKDNLKEILTNYVFPKFPSNWEFVGANKPILEEPIYSTDKKEIIGFIDLLISIKHKRKKPSQYPYDEDELHSTIIFEAKTRIGTIGELLRQIKHYAHYGSFSNPHFIVVSPDDKNADRLKDEGIIFIKYKPKIDQDDLFLIGKENE